MVETTDLGVPAPNARCISPDTGRLIFPHRSRYVSLHRRRFASIAYGCHARERANESRGSGGLRRLRKTRHRTYPSRVREARKSNADRTAAGVGASHFAETVARSGHVRDCYTLTCFVGLGKLRTVAFGWGQLHQYKRCLPDLSCPCILSSSFKQNCSKLSTWRESGRYNCTSRIYAIFTLIF